MLSALRPRATALLLCAVCVLAAAYLHLMLVGVHFASADDHDLVVTTLVGKWLPPDIWPRAGRFDPLTGQELNLISLVANSLVAYYAFNAVELVLFCAVFVDLMRGFGDRSRALLALAILLLLPGFAISWLRLEVSERDSLVLFAVMLWSYRRFERSPLPRWFAATGLAANLALYNKETSFLMIGAFACLRIAASVVHGRKETRRLDLFLLSSAALYLALYALLIYPQWGATLYGANPAPPLLRAVKYLGDYATTDPILVFVVLPLAAVRAVAILRRPVTIEPWADPLLAAAATYAGGYLILNMHQPYYWLPAYAAGLPALLAWSRHPEMTASRVWRWGSPPAALLLVLGAVPATLFQISSIKYADRNHDAMLAFLSADISAREDRGPLRVTLDGIEADSELYQSLSRFLVYRGVPRHRFELLPTVSPYGAGGTPTGRASGGSDARSDARAADYLIVTPDRGINVDDAYLSAIERDYRLAFRTTSDYALPNLSVRVFFKYLVRRLFPGLAMKAGVDAQTSYGVDYYVFVRR